MKKKENKKYKLKVLMLSLSTFALVGVFVLTLGTWVDGFKLSKDKSNLENQLTTYLEEEQELKSQIAKLQDPEYIAKYAREKYLYSKKGEIIIRIED